MARSSVSPAWPGLFWGRHSLVMMGLCLVLFGQRWADTSLGWWRGPSTLLCSNTEGPLADYLSPCLDAENGLLKIKSLSHFSLSPSSVSSLQEFPIPHAGEKTGCLSQKKAKAPSFRVLPSCPGTDRLPGYIVKCPRAATLLNLFYSVSIFSHGAHPTLPKKTGQPEL